ncbi:hypothetical protein ACTQ56_00790 [[Clostridium] aminophilum]|uniref:hypothetical protein n=1 Tax=[Clostridium] aminophilum TaxID=1526 RepID=UPI003F964332
MAEKITYAYFIRRNALKDCKESFRIYQETHGDIFRKMNPEMQEQFINQNYGLRFINNPWA